ncbi:hypothetical protein [Psychroserpens sp. S379A]|uniref:hypothetical protein n=1 Tax=Psychroserpens sp. S379A TaxID=3415137 RepID=UPI003C7DD183
MPIYPPRNTATKKRQILNYKIFEFLTLNESETTAEKLNNKAEEVRIAMLNLIKAKIKLTNVYKKDDENEVSIQLWEKLSNDKINWETYTFKEIKDFCDKNRKV